MNTDLKTIDTEIGNLATTSHKYIEELEAALHLAAKHVQELIIMNEKLTKQVEELKAKS